MIIIVYFYVLILNVNGTEAPRKNGTKTLAQGHKSPTISNLDYLNFKLNGQQTLLRATKDRFVKM